MCNWDEGIKYDQLRWVIFVLITATFGLLFLVCHHRHWLAVRSLLNISSQVNFTKCDFCNWRGCLVLIFLVSDPVLVVPLPGHPRLPGSNGLVQRETLLLFRSDGNDFDFLLCHVVHSICISHLELVCTRLSNCRWGSRRVWKIGEDSN